MSAVGSRVLAPVFVLLTSGACAPDPGGDTGAGGTGGDDNLPGDPDPGPDGPGCPDGRVPIVLDGDAAALAQSGQRAGRILFSTAAPLPERGRQDSPDIATLPTSSPAVVRDPHSHERWSHAQKLELSYCVSTVSGSDEEEVDNYHKLLRYIAQTVPHWERATESNFVHVREDDAPFRQQCFTEVRPGTYEACGQCQTGQSAYFAVMAGFRGGPIFGATNFWPQSWDDPELDPFGMGRMGRFIFLTSQQVEATSSEPALGTLRHELGHAMGFLHEETFSAPSENDCAAQDARLVATLDPDSVMNTPGCPGGGDLTDFLSPGDRLSAYLIHHASRTRFETRGSGVGYRWSGISASGAEILWHRQGSTEGTLWTPAVGPAGIEFTEYVLPYFPSATPPASDWFPLQGEAVLPLRLTGNEDSLDLLFYGPGSDQRDFVSRNAGGTLTAIQWAEDEHIQPVVGAFDSERLGVDAVYLYGPGDVADRALWLNDDGQLIVDREVPQFGQFAYPLAAPYRGTDSPDDILWWDPLEGEITIWILGEGILNVVGVATTDQSFPEGEVIPALGDFNGDGKADILWYGVGRLPAAPELQDELWLSESVGQDVAFEQIHKEVGSSYRPFVGDFDGDGRDDIFWHRNWEMTSDGPSESETGASFIWYFDADGGHTSESFVLEGDFSPYVGDFDADGCHDIGWFDSVGDALTIWRCLPGGRDFECGAPSDTPENAAPLGVHWGF